MREAAFLFKKEKRFFTDADSDLINQKKYFFIVLPL